jgi:hypothetical protein
MSNALVPLETLGKSIVDRVEKGQKYHDKAQEMFTSAGKMLVELRDRVNEQKLEGGFKAAVKKYCPGLSRSRAYEILAIADGTKTIAQVRGERATRERNRHTVSTMVDTEKGETSNAVVTTAIEPEADPELDSAVEPEADPELDSAVDADDATPFPPLLLVFLQTVASNPADFIRRIGAGAAEAFARAILAELGVDTEEDAPDEPFFRLVLKPGEALIWDDYAPDKNDGNKRRGSAEPIPGELDYLIAPQFDTSGEVEQVTYKRNGNVKSRHTIASGDLSYDDCKAAAQANWNGGGK